MSAHPLKLRSRDLLWACLVIAIAAAVGGGVANACFSANEMYVVWPAIAAAAVFAGFSAVLVVGWRLSPLTEIGFVYLGIALLYTVVPAAKFLVMHLEIPQGFGDLNFATLDWTPREMGEQFWRQVLLISGVAIGYLVFRGCPVLTDGERYSLRPADGKAIGALLVIVTGCIIITTSITGSAGTYAEHYVRLDALSPSIRRLVYVLLAVKGGSYYVLLVWLFGRYRKYRTRLLLLATAICAYEVVYSHGARIVAFFVILAFIGLYNLQVRSISLRRGTVVLALLACGFVSIETIRLAAEGSLKESFQTTVSAARASEFEAVYATGYHLYNERANARLPALPALLGIYEVIAIVPFLDHTTNHPMFWYAQEYFPNAPVPPATMGIVAMSALWGGEWSLLVYGLLNGFLYAHVVRWFERRREKWWALATYVFLYATSIMILKYSLLYQLVLFAQTLGPALLVGAAVVAWTRSRARGSSNI